MQTITIDVQDDAALNRLKVALLGVPGAEIQDGRLWTVVGVWISDEPIVTGVIEGRHDVTGGDMAEFEQGCWAVSVTADDADEAESTAVAEMLGEPEDDEDGDDL